MPEIKNFVTRTNFWSAVDELEEQKWKEQFQQLVNFKKETGMLPARNTDHKLFYWLIMQRKKAKEGKLTENQLTLYKEAGINVLGRFRKE